MATHDAEGSIRRFRGASQGSLEWFRAAYPAAEEVELPGQHRFGPVVGTAVHALLGEQADSPPSGGGAVRFWRCEGERAQAQAAAREIESRLSAGETLPERICVVVGSGWRQGRLVAAALEERNVPFRVAGDASFFARPEVRDALAWLRMLADPFDAAAVVRALTRPPVDLRSADLARVTTIARRRKLDMVTALDAALESPQLMPEARDRIQAFLKLQRSAAAAMEAMRPDVFVRRLIERVGMRRHRLFAATPETAERLVNLSRLAELAADWSRRVPRGSVRDFVRHLAAVAEAGEVGAEEVDPPAPGAVMLAEPAQVKGLEFDAVYLLGLHAGSMRLAPWEDRWVPEELATGSLPEAGDELATVRQRRLAYLAITRASKTVVLSWPEESDGETASPAPFYEVARDALGAAEEVQAEEVFGPAEGLHSTYRMIRDEVLESSWRAGSALSEMRLDTAEDVNAAVARYLELIKLASLLQRPDREATREALGAINELLARVATPEQRAVIETSALDDYVLGEEKAQEDRRASVAARREPSLEQFIPRRGDGLALSASDIGLYRTCPLKYKFARVFSIPQEPTINQRFGILIHNVLERFHSEEMRAQAGGADGRPAAGQPRPAPQPAGGRLAPDGLRRVRRRASVPRPRGRRARALPRAPCARGLRAGLARAKLLVRDRRPPPARPDRPRGQAPRRRLRADRLQDGRVRRQPRSSPRTSSSPSTGWPRARPGSSRLRRAPTGTSSPTSGSRSSRRPTTPSASSAPSSTSREGSRPRTSSLGRRSRSARGATTG